MRRFFFRPSREHEELVTLDREESHHLSRVLRLGPGELVELFDGVGGAYRGRVERVGREVVVRVLAQLPREEPHGAMVRVCQAGLKGKKMELVIQKCTELGVASFFPFSSGRSQPGGGAEAAGRRRERWRKVVEGACKQSGRRWLMELEGELSMSRLLGLDCFRGSGRRLLFWEGEQHRRLGNLDWEQETGPVSLMFGPEGGFAAEEVERAGAAGWVAVSLGERVLRAETAVIAAISVVQHRLGRI